MERHRAPLIMTAVALLLPTQYSTLSNASIELGTTDP
jgi:hypothetical protein